MERSAYSAETIGSARRLDPLLLLTVLAVLLLALWPVQIDRAFGLPAHPLLIHLPVVAIPVLGLSLLVGAVWPQLLDRNGTALGILTLICLAATLLAVGAGEAFRESGEGGPGIAEHADVAETLRLVMVGVTVVVLAALWARRHPGLSWGLYATRVAFVIAAVAATFFVIRTGHLGAAATWEQEGGGGPPAEMQQ